MGRVFDLCNRALFNCKRCTGHYNKRFTYQQILTYSFSDLSYDNENEIMTKNIIQYNFSYEITKIFLQ